MRITSHVKGFTFLILLDSFGSLSGMYAVYFGISLDYAFVSF